MSKRRPQPRLARALQWAQFVDEPDAWAVENCWLLEAAFDLFSHAGEWPLIEEVQREIADQPERAIAVRQLVVDIPPALGARMSQRVELTVRALSHCPAAAPLLEIFVRAMRAIVERYPGEGPEQPVIRGAELKSSLGLDDATYQKVSVLLSSEGWFFGNGGGDVEGDWYRVIRAEILCLNEITDIRSYLDAVARYRFGSPEVEVAMSVEPPRGRLDRPRRWLSKREASVADLLAITVAGGVVVGVVLWLLLG